jgi:hypothetical protein
MVDQGILTKQREKLAKFAFVAAVWGCYADREHHYVNAKESPYQKDGLNEAVGPVPLSVSRPLRNRRMGGAEAGRRRA